jgi:hypothetical protein
MEEVASLEEALELAKHLSPLDKARLIQLIVPDIERELEAAETTRRKSLRGLWRGLDITDEDIAEARRGMWSDFPQEDM